MRAIADYLAKALEFDELAKAAADARMKKADGPHKRRALVKDRRRLCAVGALKVIESNTERFSPTPVSSVATTATRGELKPATSFADLR